MNARERYLAAMNFKPVDCLPNYELGLWGQTYERWLAEGLPENELAGDWFEGEPPVGRMDKRAYIKLNLNPLPGFARTLEETDRYIVFVDDWGQTRKGLKEGARRGCRMSMDMFLDFFVKDRRDFAELKKHFDPADPSRYPAGWEALKAQWKNRDYPLYLTENCGFGGLYWNLRQLMGTENLSYAFYDQPGLVHEMLDFMVDFFIQVTARALSEVDVDACIINEDFACKSGPLLSPAMYREFLLPRHRRMIEYLRGRGVKIIELDSDGNIEPLIPLLLEAGVNCLWPLEAASGMEPVKVRREYGRRVALMGGIDKRELFGDRRAIERELQRKLAPLVERGGYLPTIDHTVPPEVPLENFRYYIDCKMKLLAGRG